MAGIEVSADTLAKIAESVGLAVVKASAEHEEKYRPHEIPRSIGRSALNPRAGEPGYAKPKLSRQTIFCSHEERGDELLPEEIELYNKVTRPGRYHNRRWEVIVKTDELDPTQSSLEIRIPCKEINDRIDMPNSLTAILREIIAEGEQRAAAEKKK